jgi:DNA-binding response OmpR family regulator
MSSVLVIDDDLDLLEMVSMVLSSYGLSVQTISQGNQVNDSLDEFIPDVILMDIYLGDVDGRDICSALKTSLQYQHIPIILYSAGYITSTSIEASRADDFLAKPFDNKQLFEKIRGFIPSN